MFVGSLSIVNSSSSEAITINSIIASQNIKLLGGSCDTVGILSPGVGCTESFGVGSGYQLGTSFGEGAIDVNYTGASGPSQDLTKFITWFNSSLGVLLNAQNPITNIVNDGESVTQNITNSVSFTNSESFILINVIPSIVSNSSTTGTAVIPSDASNTCKGTSLNPGDICYFDIVISDSLQSGGAVVYNLSADNLVSPYASTYTYSPVSNTPNLVFNQGSILIVPPYDNSTAGEESITVTNIGDASATFSGMGVRSSYWYLFNNFVSANCYDSSGNVLQSLPSGSSCTVSFEVYPYPTVTEIQTNFAFQIQYSGGDQSLLRVVDTIGLDIKACNNATTNAGVDYCGSRQSDPSELLNN